MTSPPPAPRMLHCSIIGAATGAATCALVLVGWPDTPGVVWTATEARWLALLGLAVGGLLGGLLGAGSRRAGGSGAAVAGLVPALLWTFLPLLPVYGRTLVRIEPGALGLLAGAGVVAWGVVRTVRSPRTHAALALLFAGVVGMRWPADLHAPAPALGGPDLLLVTIDTTRADLVPGFGGDRAPADMPFMEAWSAGARRFTRAYTPTALTGPAHTSVLSGQHVLEHGIFANGRDIPSATSLVPEVLRARGWHTRARVSAAVLDAGLGFSRGFDTYDSTFAHRLQYGHPLLAVWPRKRVGGRGFVRADAQTVDLVVQAPDHAARTFTWVHLYGPHWPYTPTEAHAEALGVAPALDTAHSGPVPLNHTADLPEATRTHAIALYEAELRTLDDQLARLLGPLPDHTRVVVVADHGESLDEHGLLFNHGRLATTPSTRVPLWVRGPDYPPGVDDRTVSLHQVAPTLLHLADAADPAFGDALHQTRPGAVAVSVASAAVFRDDAAPHPGTLGDFASVAVRSDAWSYAGSVWHPPTWTDLTAHPRETGPARSPPPDAVTGRILRTWADTVAQELRAPTEVDAETARALEALGYVEPGPPENAEP